jgi:hypothetical protein
MSTTAKEKITNPKRKALQINLDPSIYGSFAEIGAGQDVARRFFEAGGASGTIAKSTSAYDMHVSDTMYGKTVSKRYVSEERLKKMLNVEFEGVKKLLHEQRGKESRFFAFADTISAINYHKTNDAHGWIGVKFQTAPNHEPSEVILHVKLHENDYFLQQRTIGILGVNLLYACYHYFDEPVSFIQSLMDYLTPDQIEIDMMRFCNDKICIDNRLLSLLLVKYGLTKVTMFDRNMNVQQPSDMLYKKDVLLLRGSFRPPTYVEFDMLKSGSGIFKKEIDFDKKNYVVLCEMSLDNIMNDGSFQAQDYLNRVDLLCGMGVNVVISNYREHYRLLEYFNRIKIKNLGVVTGIKTFIDIMDEKYYDHLKGGLLEATGKMFASNTKMYVYPALDRKKKALQTTEHFKADEKKNHLIEYLKSENQIEDIIKVNKEYLNIYSRDVYKLISTKKQNWEDLVPNYIAKEIKEKRMFGYEKKLTTPGLGGLKI